MGFEFGLQAGHDRLRGLDGGARLCHLRCGGAYSGFCGGDLGERHRDVGLGMAQARRVFVGDLFGNGALGAQRL